MGGAGTPAFRKWDTLQKASSPKKFVVCNADESEVGTFKDREIMKALPHLLVEAMAIAGVTLGADKGYIYVRHEYHEQIEILRQEIKRARGYGAVGPNVFGSHRAFDLEVFVSPGGYVQGEETALLEAIEGRRGQPRNKPWDVGLERGVPAFQGLFGKPTLINNVETFIYVPVILNKGPEWFCSQAVSGCQGLKWVGVGGHVNKPGVFEIPMGTTYREIIEMCGGMLDGLPLKAICPSGPTGGFMPASFADVPLDFQQLGPKGEALNEMAKAGGTAGSAAIVIIAEGTCLVDAALNYTRFYRNESCGKCVPCRVGSQKIVDIIAGVAQGTARDNDLAEIDRLADTLMMTSICGLGQVVPTPIKTVMKHFPQEVEDHLVRKTCPSGICFSNAGRVENVNSAVGKDLAGTGFLPANRPSLLPRRFRGAFGLGVRTRKTRRKNEFRRTHDDELRPGPAGRREDGDADDRRAVGDGAGEDVGARRRPPGRHRHPRAVPQGRPQPRRRLPGLRRHGEGRRRRAGRPRLRRVLHARVS